MRTPPGSSIKPSKITVASLKTHQLGIYMETPEAQDTKLSSISGPAMLLLNHKINNGLKHSAIKYFWTCTNHKNNNELKQ
jgi:hypothetical protein